MSVVINADELIQRAGVAGSLRESTISLRAVCSTCLCLFAALVLLRLLPRARASQCMLREPAA